MNKRAQQASIIRKDADRHRDAREDADWVAKAQRGDVDAFRALFDRYHRRAYALAFGVVRNTDDALDVVQDAFIKAHRHLANFEGSSSFYTWLYRIVMNVAIDHVRKHRRTVQVDLADGIGESAKHTDQEESLLPSILGQNPAKALIRTELREKLNAALSALSDNHRAVLIMREVEGLSYEEMAQVMQCSKGTIMSRLFHARRNMQKHLQEYLDSSVKVGA